jgi:group I intron endonuclease
MFIYKITNIKNNKIYIGLTTEKSIQERFRKHNVEARCTSDNRYFLNAIRKYGASSFRLEEIDRATTLEELKNKEIYYIKFYNSRDRKIGYNLSEGGDGTKGVLKSAETREKLRQKALGRVWSEERKARHSKMMKESNRDFSVGIENFKQHNIKTSKIVEKYVDNKLVSTYKSITEAASLNNINRITLIRYLNKQGFDNNKLCKGSKYKVKVT